MSGKTEHKLTKNQALVLDSLNGSSAPMSAYSILDELRTEGFRAPLQVYRAIEKLTEFGLVHRIESMNAFVACKHPSCSDHEAMIFMICESCNRVDELADKEVSGLLESLAGKKKFALGHSTVELSGRCGACQH